MTCDASHVCEKSLDFSGYQYDLYTESATTILSVLVTLWIFASCTAKRRAHTCTHLHVRVPSNTHITRADQRSCQISPWFSTDHTTKLSDKNWTKRELVSDWGYQSRGSTSEQLLVFTHWVCLDGHLFEFSVDWSTFKGIGRLHGHEARVGVEWHVEGVCGALLEG